MYVSYSMQSSLVDQACAQLGARAVPLSEHVFAIPGRGFVEFHPDRPHHRWDAERLDDENMTVLTQHDHAFEAVRSIAT